MTAMTTAMTEAYFRATPKTDWIYLTHHKRWPHGYTDQSRVRACNIDHTPWRWNAGFGLLIHKHTGVAKPRTGFKPKSAEPFYDVRTINAEVSVEHTRRDWLDSEVEIMAPTVVDTSRSRRSPSGRRGCCPARPRSSAPSRSAAPRATIPQCAM